MKKILERIKELENISKELEPSESVRAEYYREIQNYTNGFINEIEELKAYSDEKVNRKDLLLGGNKRELRSLLETFKNEVASKGITAGSGGHIGYIPGGGIFTAAIADFLAAVTNEYAGLYYASPGAVVIEDEIINWLKSIFGFPVSAVGTLTSGGSIANLIAMTAARDKHSIKSDRITRSIIYLSPQAHHSINKALKIIGLEDIIIRYLDLDEYSRIDIKNLTRQIIKDRNAGLNPFMVVASAGTTDTGAVDPLAVIGKIALENKIWYHIDAAYGGFFILTKLKKKLLRGIEMADSLVTDPHKGLFLPYGTGAVLLKDKEAVLHSHQYTANYMQDSARNVPTILNPADISPELTRHFRALRVWLPLQIHGIEPFIACLEEKLLLTQYFRRGLLELGFKTGPVPDLSVSYFWYPSRVIDENIYNQKLLELILKDGNVFFSSTKINNKFVIRIAVLSFRTRLKTIDKALDLINKAKFKLESQFNFI